jgi:4-hydroxymandelate oxidase
MHGSASITASFVMSAVAIFRATCSAVASAEGLGQAGALMVLSSLSTRLLEDVASASEQPKWFQLYINRDRGFTKELIARVEAAGFKALVVTADAPQWGKRYLDIRNGFHLPPGMEAINLAGCRPEASVLSHAGAGMGAAMTWMLNPALTWEDVEWLCQTSRLPVLVKGICREDDAVTAFARGAAGVVISNHGGRQLDSAPATISVLPSVRAAVGPDRLILLDGGIRRGTDVLKAIALGANAVQIGRPVVWGLAVGGSGGVARVVNVLRDEFELAMALSGVASLDEITPDLIRTGAV